MKSPKTQRQETYKKALAELVEKYPDARKVVKRYDVMKAILRKEWANTLMKIGEKNTIDDFLKDVVYIDRQIRKATEGSDILKKKILSQEFQIKELGMESQTLVKDFEKELERQG